MVPGIRQVFICVLLFCHVSSLQQLPHLFWVSVSYLENGKIISYFKEFCVCVCMCVCVCVCVCEKEICYCVNYFIVHSTWWWVNNKMLPNITVCFAIIIIRNIIFKSHDAAFKWSHHNLWGIKYFPIWNIDSYTAFALKDSFSIKVQQFKYACGDTQAHTYSQTFAWRPFGGRWLDSELILVAKEGLADSPPAIATLTVTTVRPETITKELEGSV